MNENNILQSNSKKLRELLESPRVEQILEAHNSLSATIVEEAGISGLWASSLTLSCAAGLRDNSELTMTEVLDVLETILRRALVAPGGSRLHGEVRVVDAGHEVGRIDLGCVCLRCPRSVPAFRARALRCTAPRQERQGQQNAERRTSLWSLHGILPFVTSIICSDHVFLRLRQR